MNNLISKLHKVRTKFQEDHDATHGRIESLETDICMGKYPQDQVDTAVNLGLLRPGSLQSYYILLT